MTEPPERILSHKCVIFAIVNNCPVTIEFLFYGVVPTFHASNLINIARTPKTTQHNKG